MYHLFGFFSLLRCNTLSFSQATLNHYPYYLSALSRMLLHLCMTAILETAACMQIKDMKLTNRKSVIKPPLFHRAYFLFDYSPRNFANKVFLSNLVDRSIVCQYLSFIFLTLCYPKHGHVLVNAYYTVTVGF